MNRFRPGSLRGRTILYFGAGSLSVAALFAVSTYLLARGYLLHERTDSVQRRTVIDARVVTARLDSRGAQVDDVLTSLDPLSASVVLVRRDGQWYSTSLDVGADSLPDQLVTMVVSGKPGVQVAEVSGRPAVVVGLPLPTVDGQLFEVSPLDELTRSLNILAAILAIGSVVAAIAGVGIAIWSSRRLLVPLDALASAAAEIAGGEISRRLEPTDDPDLITIVGSFNSMVDALQARIERDSRFAGDVSHELRTPLTTLVAAVDVLEARRDEMNPRLQQAVGLASMELVRFRHLLDELIELARFDAGIADQPAPPVDVRRLLEEIMERSDRPRNLLRGSGGYLILGDKRRLERAFVNLMDNADKHGKGLVSVEIVPQGDRVQIWIDDAGPGVRIPDRDHVFSRFATGGGGRGSTRGTGLGLAIVQETVSSLSGQVWITDRLPAGARFVVELPIVEAT